MSLVPEDGSVAVPVILVFTCTLFYYVCDKLARRQNPEFDEQAERLSYDWWQLRLKKLHIGTVLTTIVSALATYKAASGNIGDLANGGAIGFLLFYHLSIYVWWYVLVSRLRLSFSAGIACFVLFCGFVGLGFLAGASPLWAGLMAIPVVWDAYRFAHHYVLWRNNSDRLPQYAMAGVEEDAPEVV